jgi:DNA-directed RNA polymerase subunit RPC12/RpoP
MDIVFNCPHCSTELEVESDAAGESIDCPACQRAIQIPAASPVTPASAPRVVTPPPPPTAAGSKEAPATAASPEKKFSVPVTNKPVEPLIQKALPSLKAQAASDGKKRLCVKTLRHSDCKEVGKDRFDETVTDFLNGIGEENIISITPINYSYVEMGTQKLITDFGMAIVYRQ